MYNKLPVKERIELMKSYRKANKDMSYRDMVKDYNDSYEKFKGGGEFNDYTQPGPLIEQSKNNNLGMTGLMKSKIATEAHYGNPAALRMVSPNPNKYTFTGEEKDWKGNQASPAGSSGTHFMGSYGDQARPGLQEVNGKMQYFQNPPRNSKENFNFSRPEDAEYFAEHYKEVAPMMRNWEKHKYGGIQKFDGGGEFDDEGSIIKNKLNKNTLAKDERSNQDNTRVFNLPIKTLQALQQQADVERASRQQYKQQPVISQGKKLNPTEQAYSDKVQARIANPSNDLGITAANIASALTRFRYLNPEEIAATTNNPMGTVGLSSNIMTEALVNEMAGPAFGKALTSGTKVIKKVPKELPSFSNVSKSEIDWKAWNKEIPKNKALMNEYNAIEESSKANGSWMKNADGSVFQGTPEQFVQQNSSNFKKAFPNPVRDVDNNIQINYHGQREGKPFNTFKPSQRGNHGVGNYTFPGKRKSALAYANNDEKRLYELYINSNNPQKSLETVFSPEFNQTTGRLQPEYDYLKVGKEQVTAPSNYLKSAISNNGMFDMTNPNIYKSLLPFVGASYLGAKELQKEE